MDKSIKNIDAVVCKLEPSLTKATNYRLKVANKEKWKKRNSRKPEKRSYGHKTLKS